jgi:hypothetical protein
MATAMTPQQTKDYFLAVLCAIRTRSASYSFRLVQARLSAAGMPSAAGWGPLIARYTGLNYSDPSTDWTTYVNTVSDIHRCATLFGTSAVWLFDGVNDDIQEILNVVSYADPTLSAFARDFPYPIPHDELAAQSYATTFVRGIPLHSDAVAAVACGKRPYREREQVAPEDLGDDTRAALGDFQELILVRTGFTQAFDRLIFKPQQRRLELHVDLCCPLNAEELSQYMDAYVSRVKAMAAGLGRPLDWLNTAVNLFQTVADLYNSPDGLVLSLGHATGTKSIKEERMRGQRLDLREELFHKHGIEAIKGTDAFSIKKGWERPLRRNVPSITIPGHFAMANALSPRVSYAILENCATEEDYHDLMAHLP